VINQGSSGELRYKEKRQAVIDLEYLMRIKLIVSTDYQTPLYSISCEITDRYTNGKTTKTPIRI
jgi:hypothetical protein